MVSLGTTDVNTLLLLEHAQFKPTDRVLVMSAGDPALALNVAGRVAQVDMVETSYAAYMRLQGYIRARNVSNIRDADEDVTYDVAVAVVPKGRDLARAHLWVALRALRPGGKLYIVGPTEGGAKTMIEDAGVLFGRCVTLVTKARARVGVAVRPPQVDAYPADWGADPTQPQTRVFEIPSGEITVATMPGIFSWEHLDPGTQFLLENLQLTPGLRILDVGCGNGVIGALIASHVEVQQVVMVDDYLPAVRCAQETIRINGLQDRCVAISADVYDAPEPLGTFDLIVSNPPFHRDFDVNTNVAHRIMREAGSHLNSGGRLVIVANAFLRYDEVINGQMAHSRALAKNNKYVVLEGKKV